MKQVEKTTIQLFSQIVALNAKIVPAEQFSYSVIKIKKQFNRCHHENWLRYQKNSLCDRLFKCSIRISNKDKVQILLDIISLQAVYRIQQNKVTKLNCTNFRYYINNLMIIITISNKLSTLMKFEAKIGQKEYG